MNQIAQKELSYENFHQLAVNISQAISVFYSALTFSEDLQIKDSKQDLRKLFESITDENMGTYSLDDIRLYILSYIILFSLEPFDTFFVKVFVN